MKLKHLTSPYLLTVCTFLLLTGIIACSSDPLSDQSELELQSLFVINEGNWSDGNGSITSFDPETGHSLQNQFQQINGRPLAGIIQSAVLSDDRVFIVANNTDKIEVTDTSLESIATISLTDLSLTPSAFALAGPDKGYISDLYNHSVAVVNLEDYTVDENRIEVGNNPGDMVVVDNRLYVANSGFGDDDTVTIIDIESDQVLTTVTVGNGPAHLKADDQGYVWAISSGKKAYDENWNRDPDHDIHGRLDIISGSQIIATIETGDFPRSVALDETRGQAWVVNEQAVQQIDMSSYEIVDQAFIGRSFNGIGFSEAEERLYLADSRGYTQSGQAIIFDLEGAAVDSFQVGIAPMDFLFQVQVE